MDDAPLAKHLPTRTTSQSLNQSTPLSNLDYLPRTSPRMNLVHLLLRPCQPSLKRFRTSYPVKYSSLKPLNLSSSSLKMKPTTLPKLQNFVPKYPENTMTSSISSEPRLARRPYPRTATMTCASTLFLRQNSPRQSFISSPRPSDKPYSRHLSERPTQVVYALRTQPSVCLCSSYQRKMVDFAW